MPFPVPQGLHGLPAGRKRAASPKAAGESRAARLKLRFSPKQTDSRPAILMTQQFIAKWKRAELSERSAAQQHFLDLCELLGQPKPAAADPERRGLYLSAQGTVPFFQPPVVFGRGVHKTGGGEGWADVWMKGHFARIPQSRRSLPAASLELHVYGV
jgi:hypothetical protein